MNKNSKIVVTGTAGLVGQNFVFKTNKLNTRAIKILIDNNGTPDTDWINLFFD